MGWRGIRGEVTLKEGNEDVVPILGGGSYLAFDGHSTLGLLPDVDQFAVTGPGSLKRQGKFEQEFGVLRTIERRQKQGQHLIVLCWGCVS